MFYAKNDGDNESQEGVFWENQEEKRKKESSKRYKVNAKTAKRYGKDYSRQQIQLFLAYQNKLFLKKLPEHSNASIKMLVFKTLQIVQINFT